MKKTGLVLIASLTINFIFAQTQPTIESLKKENVKLKTENTKLKQDTTYLRQVLLTCEKLNKISEFTLTHTNSNVLVEILSCKGDRNAQTVTIEFMVSHKLPHQKFQLHTGDGAPTAYDNIGNSYLFKTASFPNSENNIYTIDFIVPTDIKIKGSITFKNVLPSLDFFSLLKIDYYNFNQDGGSSEETQKVEIKNIKIDW